MTDVLFRKVDSPIETKIQFFHQRFFYRAIIGFFCLSYYKNHMVSLFKLKKKITQKFFQVHLRPTNKIHLIRYEVDLNENIVPL